MSQPAQDSGRRWYIDYAHQLTISEAHSPYYQRTLRGIAYVKGIEPFGGKEVEVFFYPAKEDTGVVFVNGHVNDLAALRRLEQMLVEEEVKSIERRVSASSF